MVFFVVYSILLSTNYLYFKFQSISMLHYEVMHYFVRAIPVIKLLNAYPNADKTAQLRVSVDLLYFKLESWGCLSGSSGSADYCHNN